MTLIVIILTIAILLLFALKKPKQNIENLNQSNSDLKKAWGNYNSNFDPENSSEPLRTFITKIVGVSYSNNDGSNRQDIISNCNEGESLLLIPELYKGKYAIAVCNKKFQQLGYLNAELAEEISDLIIRRKSKVDAKIESINGGNGKTTGVNIEIQKYVNHNRQKPIIKEKSLEKPYDPNIKMHRLSYQRNQQAYELEQNGYIDNAIELYRSIIDNKKLDMNNASMPFDRLTIIYRKRKHYDEEISTIEKWIEVMKQSPLYEEKKNTELEKLNLRLEKAKLLKEKEK